MFAVVGMVTFLPSLFISYWVKSENLWKLVFFRHREKKNFLKDNCNCEFISQNSDFITRICDL